MEEVGALAALVMRGVAAGDCGWPAGCCGVLAAVAGTLSGQTLDGRLLLGEGSAG